MKYMGSKARFARDILALVLADRPHGSTYVEPFAGGMNTICEATGPRMANDINPYLIAMWRALVAGWVPERIDAEYYNAVRASIRQGTYPAHIVGWVGFNCSYSGKWFGGFADVVHTRVGTVRDYQAEAIRNVTRQAQKMVGVEFSNLHYADMEIPPGSIIYCDPPYAGTTGYRDGFEHGPFWDWARRLSSAGHRVYVSEYAAPADFRCLWAAQAKSSLSANGVVGGSKVSTEKLFTYGRV